MYFQSYIPFPIWKEIIGAPDLVTEWQSDSVVLKTYKKDIDIFAWLTACLKIENDSIKLSNISRIKQHITALNKPQ